RLGEGPLTERTADTRACRWELVKILRSQRLIREGRLSAFAGEAVEPRSPRFLRVLTQADLYSTTLYSRRPIALSPSTCPGDIDRRRAAQSAFSSSNSTTLVWPVIGTMTPGDFTIILMPVTRMKYTRSVSKIA